MKLVTTAGTSLITNIINTLRNRCNLTEEEKKALENFSKIFKKDYNEKNKLLKEYEELKNFVKQRITFDVKTSAEIKSIIAIQHSGKFKGYPLEIELIATDSLLSPLCSEILKDLIEKNTNLKVNFNEKNIIKDLQVTDYKRYKVGLINLLNRLNQIGSNGKYFGDMALNVTGGFKGVIPYMTIFGQVNNIPIFYIFEFTDALIEIPQIPITLNEKLFDKYWSEFYKIEREGIIEKDKLDFKFLKETESLLEIEEDMVTFNPLGKILWDKYKRENFMFFTTEDIFNEINKQKNIKNILKTKFQLNYNNKSEIKNGHYVYDDGNNTYRIFYFIDGKDFYIYKTFENHDKYEKYLNERNNFNKDEFKKNAKIYKI
jgi:putative CRISPR-associated protein (TIGR02619 family)